MTFGPRSKGPRRGPNQIDLVLRSRNICKRAGRRCPRDGQHPDALRARVETSRHPGENRTCPRPGSTHRHSLTRRSERFVADAGCACQQQKGWNQSEFRSFPAPIQPLPGRTWTRLTSPAVNRSGVLARAPIRSGAISAAIDILLGAWTNLPARFRTSAREANDERASSDAGALTPLIQLSQGRAQLMRRVVEELRGVHLSHAAPIWRCRQVASGRCYHQEARLRRP